MLIYIWDRLSDEFLSIIHRHAPNIRVGVFRGVSRIVYARGLPMMVDSGFDLARRGYTVTDAKRVARRLAYTIAMSKPSEALVVLPDVFGSWSKTIEIAKIASEEFIKAAKTYKIDIKIDVAVVAHELADREEYEVPRYVFKVASEFNGEAVLAIPSSKVDMTRNSTINCSKFPNMCIRVIERLCHNTNTPVHLLGASMYILRRIKCSLRSIDTTAYRLIRLGGKYPQGSDTYDAQLRAVIWLLRLSKLLSH